MDGIEDRVRVLEKRVRRYRILNLTVVGLLILWAAFVISNLMGLKQRVAVGPVFPVKTTRLEIIDEASSRPVCVLRAQDGGGRIEVFDRDGTVAAGLDGNGRLVVRAAEAAEFPK